MEQLCEHSSSGPSNPAVNLKHQRLNQNLLPSLTTIMHEYPPNNAPIATALGLTRGLKPLGISRKMQLPNITVPPEGTPPPPHIAPGWIPPHLPGTQSQRTGSTYAAGKKHTVNAVMVIGGVPRGRCIPFPRNHRPWVLQQRCGAGTFAGWGCYGDHLRPRALLK